MSTATVGAQSPCKGGSTALAIYRNREAMSTATVGVQHSDMRCLINHSCMLLAHGAC